MNAGSDVIAFIPGWGFKSSIGKQYLHQICNTFIDLPDPWGLSDLPDLWIPSDTSTSNPDLKSCSIENVCRHMEAALSGRRRMILLGWSLGGLIAVNLYHRKPENYKAMILVNFTPCFSKGVRWPGISLSNQRIFTDNLEQPYQTFVTYYLSLMAYPYPSSLVSSAMLATGAGIETHLISEALIHRYKAYVTILFQTDARRQYVGIKIPALLIQGSKDPIIPSSIHSYLKKLNPSVDYRCIEGAGHVPFVSHSKETHRLIQNFLETVL
ncbi:MAG: alpha/beta fold hydrolase [Caedimonas sp.]|nr:alpha/beta fold hydrolase [Caedimonas sp.]